MKAEAGRETPGNLLLSHGSGGPMILAGIGFPQLDSIEKRDQTKMTARIFYTRSPMLADLRQIVQENTHDHFQFTEYRQLFNAVDAYCTKNFPLQDRGGWFSPRVVGGSQVNNVPPHIIFAVYAIYMHLAHGDVDPVPYLAAPLEMKGATAVLLEPSDRFTVVDREGQAYPMTDFIVIIPTSTPVAWTLDTYGLPPLQQGIEVIGWHAAAQPHSAAMITAQLLMHAETRKVLDPLAAFTEEEEALFFAEPVNHTRLARYRDRLVEVFATPFEVLRQNSLTAIQILETYFAL